MSPNMTEKQLVQELQQRNTNALKQVYQKHREPFIAWASGKFPTVEKVIIEDVYSESVVDFYENILKNKYKYSASIKTYLFTLGRNKIVNIIQKKITHQRKTDEIVIQEESRTTVSPEATQRQNEQAAVIKVLMSQLCENCRNVLTLFYFHEQSMKEIAEKMNYKNANVSKTKKRECFKKLMKLAKEKYSKTDFF